MTRYRRAKLMFNIELITIEACIVLSIILAIEHFRPVC